MASEAKDSIEILQWLKSVVIAPEYHPTVDEFRDPIAYIYKIEKEASLYGICKIVPPLPPAPKRTAVFNLNRSLSNRSSTGEPTFTTRKQKIGFCGRKNRPVWQSGESYTLKEFEAKAKTFEKNYLKSKKTRVNDLEIESLYWKAGLGKPFKVEYANDMPGSAFSKGGVTNSHNVGETEWNMRRVSRAKGSLLRYMKEEIPGVTSPMVYIAMLFSWFAWHVEDHDLHSLNYLHMGAPKTWYGVPKDSAMAFEEVIRFNGYGGEVNPLVTFATLGQKNTLLSPEVLINAGIPCCRLVQNPGDFVVTFPRAYHSGFSHGFNCGEAANIATPEWLTVAKDAAIRRASINFPPMVSHFQLLYDVALSLSTRVLTKNIHSEPRSARLKDKKKREGESLVKECFVKDVVENNHLLNTLAKGSTVVILPRILQGGSPSRGGSGSFTSLCSPDLMVKTRKNLVTDQGLFSCVTCGILCFACVAIIQPTEMASKCLTSGDDHHQVIPADMAAAPTSDSSGCIIRTTSDLLNITTQPTDPIQPLDDEKPLVLKTELHTGPSSLALLAMTYGNCSDSENEDDDDDEGKIDNSRNHLAQSSTHGSSTYYDPPSLPNNCTDGSNSSLNNPRSNEDSARMHIFCLQHAVQAEQQLQAIGGAHVTILCHPDYPKLEDEAKKMAEELGNSYIWSDISSRKATKNDEEIVELALDSEEAIHGNNDWTVKLGLNLYYSADLSRSPRYRKEMPYNSVLDSVFGQNRDKKVIVTHVGPSETSKSERKRKAKAEENVEVEDIEKGLVLSKPKNIGHKRMKKETLGPLIEDGIVCRPRTRIQTRSAQVLASAFPCSCR